MRESQKKRRTRHYEQRRREVIQILGSKCVKCSSTEDLEIDHIDPTTKSEAARVGHGSWITNNYNEVMEELEKCQLLCKDCHKVKSDNEKRNNFCWRGHDKNIVGRLGKKQICKACAAINRSKYSARDKYRASLKS